MIQAHPTMGQEPGIFISPTRQPLQRGLLFLGILFSQVLYAKLRISGLAIGGGYALIFLFMAVMVHTESFYPRDLRRIFLLGGGLIFTGRLMPYLVTGNPARLETMILFFTSLATGYLVYVLVRRRAPDALWTSLDILFYTAFILSLLEPLLPALQSFLYEIRVALYPEHIYGGHARDMSVFGKSRAIFLFSEPAHLAFFLITFGYLKILRQGPNASNRDYLKVTLILILSLWANRSMVFVVGIAVMGHAYLVQTFIERLSLGKLLRLAAMGLAAMGAMLYAWITLLPRITTMVQGTDFSSAARIISPIISTAAVLGDYPWFGTAIGRGDILGQYILSAMAHLGFSHRLGDFSMEHMETLMPNYFCLHWSYNGLVGGIILLWIILKLYRIQSRKKCLLVFVPIVLWGWCIGLYLGSKIWIFMALLSATYDRFHSREVNMQNAPEPYQSQVPEKENPA